jgi:hypothetical protein
MSLDIHPCFFLYFDYPFQDEGTHLSAASGWWHEHTAAIDFLKNFSFVCFLNIVAAQSYDSSSTNMPSRFTPQHPRLSHRAPVKFVILNILPLVFVFSIHIDDDAFIEHFFCPHAERRSASDIFSEGKSLLRCFFLFAALSC